MYDKGLLPRDGVTFRDSDSEMDFTNKEKAQSPYKRTRSQPSTGRTSAYDFDEWSRVHYGYAMDRRAAAKQKHEANQEKAKNSRKDEQSDYLIFGAILSCLLLTGITLGGRSDFDNISLDDNSNKRDDS